MGKFGSVRYNLCDNFLAEVHTPPGIERAPSPLRERQDIPCTAYGNCSQRARQAQRRQREHCCLYSPIIDFKGFQWGDKEPLGEFRINKDSALASPQSSFAIAGEQALLYGGYNEKRTACKLFQLADKGAELVADVRLDLPSEVDLSKSIVIGRNGALHVFSGDDWYLFSIESLCR